MTGKLVVKAFGPITEATIALKRFVCFIGGQGVGKSSLAKIHCVVTDGRIYCAPSYELRNKMFLLALRELNIHNYISNDTYIEYHDEYTLLDNEQKYIYSINLTFANGRCEVNVEKNGETVAREDIIGFFYMRSMWSMKSHNIHNIYENKDATEYQKSQQLLESFRDSLYIPAERIMYAAFPKLLPALSIVGEALPRHLLYFMLEYNKARVAKEEHNISIFNIKFKSDNDQDYVVLPHDKKLLFNEASSGMQSSIPLMLTMRYSLNEGHYHSYVIEEPESNLYPENQIALVDSVIGDVIAAEVYSTLIITTHSPYIANYLNVLLRRSPGKGTAVSYDDLAVYFVDESGHANSIIAKDEETGEYVVDTYDLSEPMGYPHQRSQPVSRSAKRLYFR